MKKIFLMLILITSTTLFTSCSEDNIEGDNTIQGTWKLFKVELKGIQIPISGLNICYLESTYIFENNGDAIFNLYDKINGNCILNESVNGKWTNLKDNEYRLTYDDTTAFTGFDFEIVDNVVTIDFEYENETYTLFYKKE